MSSRCSGCGAGDEKWRKLTEIIADHKSSPGALIRVLHKAQMLFGHLPKEVQLAVAEGLGLPASEVYGVVTFYSFFSIKPRGKYIVGVCMGTACYVKGAAAVLEALKKELGVTPGNITEDGLFSLRLTPCVGACALAPVVAIGDDVYSKLTPDKIPEVVAKYRQSEAVAV